MAKPESLIGYYSIFASFESLIDRQTTLIVSEIHKNRTTFFLIYSETSPEGINKEYQTDRKLFE